jgi:micrococcal nuclease
MYKYKCKVLKVVDGDTVDVDIDLGFGIWLKNERVRLKGIDTPESRTRDLVEKKFGLAAKTRLKQMIGKGEKVILKTYADKDGQDMKGKFGRILGDFTYKETTVVNKLIEEGHGVAYHGQSKDDIKEQHLKNREKLISEGLVTL